MKRTTADLSKTIRQMQYAQAVRDKQPPCKRHQWDCKNSTFCSSHAHACRVCGAHEQAGSRTVWNWNK